MKSKPQSNSPPTSEAILAILAEQDAFGHEMRVRRILQTVSDGNILHGGTYSDPLQQKVRQFDFRFVLSNQAARKRIRMAIECKSVPLGSPLIFTGTSRVNEEAYHEFFGSRFGRRDPPGIIRGGPPWELWHCAKRQSIYSTNVFVGKSLVRRENNKNGESDIYDRWTQAVNSAFDLCRDAIEATLRDDFGQVVLPVVVVPDETMWEVGYDSSTCAPSTPKAVDEVRYFIGQKVPVPLPPHTQNHAGNRLIFQLSHVHFFTLRGIGQFLAKLSAAGADWDEWFPEGAQELTGTRYSTVAG